MHWKGNIKSHTTTVMHRMFKTFLVFLLDASRFTGSDKPHLPTKLANCSRSNQTSTEEKLEIQREALGITFSHISGIFKMYMLYMHSMLVSCS